MTNEQDYVVFKVSGLTQRVGLEDQREFNYQHFRTIIDFLQNNNLVVSSIVSSLDDVNDDTELKMSDLTEEGLEFIRVGYQRWLAKLDRGGSASDYVFLERQLKNQRKKAE